MKTRLDLLVSVAALVLSSPLPAQTLGTSESPTKLQTVVSYRRVQGSLAYQEPGPSGGPPVERRLGHHPITVTPLAMPAAAQTVVTRWDGTYSVAFLTWALPAGSVVRVEVAAGNYAAEMFLDLDDEVRARWVFDFGVPAGTLPVEGKVSIAPGQLSAQFNILACALDGRRYAGTYRIDTDDVTKVRIEYPSDEWSHFTDGDEIRISGLSQFGYGGAVWDPDEDVAGDEIPAEHGFLDSVIVHEYGHHLVDDISDRDGGGGKHSAWDENGFDFAWSEGFATYYALAVNLHPGTQHVSFDATPYEVNRAFDPVAKMWRTYGETSEGATFCSLFDLVDPADEPHDRMAGDWQVHRVVFEIFDREIDEGELSDGTSIDRNILGFHDAWTRRGAFPGAEPILDRILYGNRIVPHEPVDLRVEALSAGMLELETDQTFQLPVRIHRSALLYEGLPVRLRVEVRGVGQDSEKIFYLPTQTIAFAPGQTAQDTVFVFKYAAHQITWGKLVVRIDSDDVYPEANETNNHAVGPWVHHLGLFSNWDPDIGSGTYTGPAPR